MTQKSFKSVLDKHLDMGYNVFDSRIELLNDKQSKGETTMSQLFQKHIELHDIDVPAFLKLLDKCKGNVYLMSEDGDKLNLKSKLCQYIALTQMFTDGEIENVEIVLSEPEDIALLKEYLIVE